MCFTPEEYRILAGKEFNALLAEDPELRRLEGMKYDKTLEARVLMEIMGMVGSYRIGKLPCLPLTAAKWAFLWMVDSPFAIGGSAGPAEVDLVLYVLSEPDLRKIPHGVHEIPAVASGYSLATGLRTEDIFSEIRGIIHTAFQPLEMLPRSDGSGEPERFDGVWATHVAGLAARESGMPFDYCLHQMSLSSVCAFFVNWRKREGGDSDQIRRRPSEEIESEISRRIDHLAKVFLKKKV